MIRFALVVGVLTGLLLFVPRAQADDAADMEKDQKALQGVWYKLPAKDKPKDHVLVLRFDDKLAIAELGGGFASAGSATFKLRKKDGKRLLFQTDFFDKTKETVIAEYSVDGDNLVLSGKPSKIGLLTFNVAGKWKRAK
jgi:hypothetical protein